MKIIVAMQCDRCTAQKYKKLVRFSQMQSALPLDEFFSSLRYIPKENRILVPEGLELHSYLFYYVCLGVLLTV